jgi:hypothetical protein
LFPNYLKKRVVKGAGKEKKTTFDPVRTRIARRAALEFKTGMYGMATKKSLPF